GLLPFVRMERTGSGAQRGRGDCDPLPRPLREPERSLGEDVSLHLGRARKDRLGPRPEELAWPVDFGARVWAGPQQLPARTEKIERGLAKALVELAPEELL